MSLSDFEAIQRDDPIRFRETSRPDSVTRNGRFIKWIDEEGTAEIRDEFTGATRTAGLDRLIPPSKARVRRIRKLTQAQKQRQLDRQAPKKLDLPKPVPGNTCKVCGAVIPPSGKRGRPRTKCATC